MDLVSAAFVKVEKRNQVFHFGSDFRALMWLYTTSQQHVVGNTEVGGSSLRVPTKVAAQTANDKVSVYLRRVIRA